MSPGADRSSPRPAWVLFSAGGVAVSVAYFLLPAGTLVHAATFVLVSAAAVVAVGAGVRTHRPERRTVWTLLGVGQGLHVVAGVLWYSYAVATHRPLPFPSVADALFIGAYACHASAIGLLLHRRRGERNRIAWLDGAIIVGGFGLLTWVFLIAPYLGGGSSPLARVTALSYPVADLMMLALLVSLALSPGSESPALRLIAAGVLAGLFADSQYVWAALDGTYRHGLWLDMGWLLQFVAFGAAALHPSMRPLSDGGRSRTTVREGRRGRLLFLAASALVAPALILVEESRGTDPDTSILAAGAAVLSILALVRMHTLTTDMTELRRLQQALEVNEEKFRTIVETTTEWIWAIDLQGTVTYSNPAVKTVLGYRPDEVIDANCLQHVHPDDREVVAARLEEVLAEGCPWNGWVRRWRHRNGTERWLESNATPVRVGTELVGYRGADRDVTRRVALEVEMRRQAMHDPLTDLANRSLFNDRLEHALARAQRSGRHVALLMLDLDGFKGINDTFGHLAGDRVLVEVAGRLTACTRPGDTVARLGGDEFAVLVEDAGPTEALAVAERLLGSLKPPFDLDGRELFVDGSIGLAASPSGAIRPDALFRDADAAMYAAKSGGKGQIEVYREDLHVEVLRRFEMATELRRALDHGEFMVQYQPIVKLNDGAIVGAEALIRWRHPERGVVSPGEFIPVAEQTGLIAPMDRWVMQQACRQLRTWQERWPNRQERLRMSINVSVRQLQSAEVAREVRRILDETGLDPADVTLEITESVLAQDADAMLKVLGTLKDIGVKLAIDDFGIGFSSLSYLRRLPVDVVKIDRSFVAGIAAGSEEWMLARGIIKLVHGLGLGTVAEGVERADQRAHLRTLGCQLAQGFYFSRPMDPEALTELLENAESRTA